MDREAELQALIRKLGQEASNWLEGGNSSETEPFLKDNGKMSSGPVRRDLPSQTGKIDDKSKFTTFYDSNNISYRNDFYWKLRVKP